MITLFWICLGIQLLYVSVVILRSIVDTMKTDHAFTETVKRAITFYGDDCHLARYAFYKSA